MNQRIVNAANGACHNPNFDDVPGHCEIETREVCQSVYGSRYDDYWRGTAAATGQAFLDSGLGRRFTSFDDIQSGDLLYKVTTAGPNGHTGIFVDDVPGIGSNLVYENSSTPYGRIAGAKGYRPLGSNTPHEWGAPEVVVTLPNLPRLLLAFPNGDGSFNYEVVTKADMVNNTFMIDSLSVAHLLGADASVLSGGTAPIRDVLTKLGYAITDVSSNNGDEYLFVKAPS